MLCACVCLQVCCRLGWKWLSCTGLLLSSCLGDKDLSLYPYLALLFLALSHIICLYFYLSVSPASQELCDAKSMVCFAHCCLSSTQFTVVPSPQQALSFVNIIRCYCGILTSHYLMGCHLKPQNLGSQNSPLIVGQSGREISSEHSGLKPSVSL